MRPLRKLRIFLRPKNNLRQSSFQRAARYGFATLCDWSASCRPRQAGSLCSPELRGLAEDRFHACYEVVFCDELLLAGGHIFYFQLWPFVSEQHRNMGAELLGGLELLADLFARQRVIDAVAAVAEVLNLPERVGAAFFFRDHNVDVDFPVVRNCFLHRFTGLWDLVD